MASLVSVSDFEARLGRSLVEPRETLRVDSLLSDASDAVRRFTGQDFLEATTTDRVRVRNGRITLPQRPVTAVASVADVNANPILFTWLGGDQVQVSPNVPDSFAWEPWTNAISWVDVTNTHGYPADEIPGVIIAVIFQMAARAFGRDPVDSGVQQESIAGYSYSVGSAGAAGAVGMLPDERAALEPFARRAGVVQVGP